MIKILFVCHGNICRSPMAEFIMKDLAAREGMAEKFDIASAATSTEEIENAVYPPARSKLLEHGIDCRSKKARRITAEDYRQYDILVGMDQYNMRNMERFFSGDDAHKLRFMMTYAGEKRDVADPWYTEDFEQAYCDILAGCEGIIQRVKVGEAL